MKLSKEAREWVVIIMAIGTFFATVITMFPEVRLLDIPLLLICIAAMIYVIRIDYTVHQHKQRQRNSEDLFVDARKIIPDSEEQAQPIPSYRGKPLVHHSRGYQLMKMPPLKRRNAQLYNRQPIFASLWNSKFFNNPITFIAVFLGELGLIILLIALPGLNPHHSSPMSVNFSGTEFPIQVGGSIIQSSNSHASPTPTCTPLSSPTPSITPTRKPTPVATCTPRPQKTPPPTPSPTSTAHH
jgi:hypothetical protein